MTTADKLNKLLTTKQNIKDAIEEKEQVVGDIPFADYPDKIRNIKIGDSNLFPPMLPGPDTEANTISAKYTLIDEESGQTELSVYSSSGLFKELGEILERGLIFNYSIYREQIRKIKVVNARETNSTFRNMFELEEVEGLETVEILGQHTFNSCYSLYLDGNFPNVKRIDNSAFAYYSNLPSIVYFPKVEQIGYNIGMNNSTHVRHVVLGSPGFPLKSAGSQMFRDCNHIMQIDIYVENPSSPDLIGAPWGATNATITYKQA